MLLWVKHTSRRAECKPSGRRSWLGQNVDLQGQRTPIREAFGDVLSRHLTTRSGFEAPPHRHVNGQRKWGKGNMAAMSE